MAEKRYEMDMCSGPLLSKILAFTLPLVLSSVLQLLFNAADVVVVGRFAGSTALAAVGSTGSLINLIVNLFMGLSVGVSVVVARHYGAQQYADVNTAVHTAMLAHEPHWRRHVWNSGIPSGLSASSAHGLPGRRN